MTSGSGTSGQLRREEEEKRREEEGRGGEATRETVLSDEIGQFHKQAGKRMISGG